MNPGTNEPTVDGAADAGRETATSPGALIDAAWAKLESEWADPEAHRRFIALCATLEQLGEAGRRYREVRDGDPARAEEAKKRLSAVVMAATAVLMETRGASPGKRSPMTLVAIVVCSAMLTYALYTYFTSH